MYCVLINNGYASTLGGANPLTFNRADESLRDHPIVRGRNVAENVPFVATFGGSAFRLRAEVDATPLMVFRAELGGRSHRGATYGGSESDGANATRPAEGMLQGVALVTGEGRVVVSGEAAMFSA